MAHGNILLFTVLVQSALSVRINFTSCQSPQWSCVNNLPNEIVYNCAGLRNNDFIIHLKDFYTDQITSVTVQNCRDLRVVLDCPILQRPSKLQAFNIKGCERLEFVSLSSHSLLQTPSEVTIENVKEVVSLPKGIFKSPSSSTELKCAGASTLKQIRIVSTKINTINTKAFYNMTGIKNIKIDNVTITNVRNQAIEAIMGSDTVFTITNSRIDNLESKGIVVLSNTVSITKNTFNDVGSGCINITADNVHIVGNSFREIGPSGLALKAVKINITQNNITRLKTNALNSVKCLRKRTNKKEFTFSKNKIEIIEPHSLTFGYTSCKFAGTAINFNNNKMDCVCQNIAFLNTAKSNTELHNVILDPLNNNTCWSAPCTLPVDIVKILMESEMCQIALDPQVMCLLYSDKHLKNEITPDEEVTEPTPTFYLIRQANSPNGDASAALTAVDKDDLLKDSHLNMTNRTVIKVVFDSSKDFVETLRSTSSSHKRPVEESKTAPREEYVNRCVVLAAVLGAAPFLGPYLAGIPAALDVWLQGRPMAALLLPIVQAAPMAFLDAAVYAEIKDGGHPYVTGLAIAGGIFYLGPEGAILGPLLLCCLMVVLNLSSTFLRDTPSEERAALHSRVRLGAYL
ncbi:unnamed protein product [Arctia plantaginis]|uniref:Right handed beta helix domain-containing protein n=1 Tax=Arctia plantaginis TaxID=874455 RepID=A0A8S1AJM5_ARCPL|nr:unnamed protein product [Arctia plantaginis]